MIQTPTPVIGFAAWSGTGKTTLIKQIITILNGRGLHIAAIKHTHHQVDFDQPGKDSYELRHAGAEQLLVASAKRSMLITEHPQESSEPDLASLLPKLDHAALDLVLVEGFKHEPIPRIELHRSALGKPLLYPDDLHIIAIALPRYETITPTITRLDLDNPDEIADFIQQQISN